ncbi:MAG TPA: c-type cytochrome [Rhizobiaceae bacterium]|nr:c-type cytochrome [Rhizobiaceae bacterium]
MPVLLALLFLAQVSACQREERDTRPQTPAGGDQTPVPLTTLAPGGQRPAFWSVEPRTFEGNAFHLSEGKRLFSWFNCTGCHANGGGGMGPALMDNRWIYGGAIESIHASIRDGRPNGMPTFAGKIPDDQMWEIAAYILSLSGNAPSAASPSRNDDMMVHPSENRMPNASTLGKSP